MINERRDYIPNESIYHTWLNWGMIVRASEIVDPQVINNIFVRYPDAIGQTTLPFDGKQDMEIYLPLGTAQQVIARQFSTPLEDISRE